MVLFAEFPNRSEDEGEIVGHGDGHERKHRRVRHGPHALCALSQDQRRPQHVGYEQGSRKGNGDFRWSSQPIGKISRIDGFNQRLGVDELTNHVERTGGDDEEKPHDGDGVLDAEAEAEVTQAVVDFVLGHQKIVRCTVGQSHDWSDKLGRFTGPDVVPHGPEDDAADHETDQHREHDRPFALGALVEDEKVGHQKAEHQKAVERKLRRPHSPTSIGRGRAVVQQREAALTTGYVARRGEHEIQRVHQCDKRTQQQQAFCRSRFNSGKQHTHGLNNTPF